MEFRKITEDEKPENERICKAIKNPDIKTFPGYWTRFKNWENNPPFIFKKENKVLGFCAFTIRKDKTYANLYAIAIDNDLQRMNYGYELFDLFLRELSKHDVSRLKTSANKKYGGFNFFSKFGWSPIARKKDEFKFDCSLEGVSNIQDFKIEVSKGLTLPTSFQMKIYKKLDECFIKENNTPHDWW